MPIGFVRSGSSRRQRFGISFSEASYRDLAGAILCRRALGAGGYGKGIAGEKKTRSDKGVHGNPASHAHLPFGVTLTSKCKTALQRNSPRNQPEFSPPALPSPTNLFAPTTTSRPSERSLVS